MKIFVIMPFSKTTEKHTKKYWDYFFKKIHYIIRRKNHKTLKKLFNAREIKVYRASAPQGNIAKSILKDLKESDIVIAVLTDRNPNVFYELGIRHTQSKKTIMLCEESQKIPFDLSNYGVGLYKNNRFRYRRIEKELLERLAHIAHNPDKPDNPFFDFIINPRYHVKYEPAIKVSVVDQLERETSSHPPMFYREAKRKAGEVEYTGRTFFGCILELMNFTNKNTTIVNTILEVSISSKHYSTKNLYHQDSVQTAKEDVSIRPKYIKKFPLVSGGYHTARAAFVLDREVAKEISEISGKVLVVDMFGNKYSTPEIKFTSYC
jgi:hypothetical protein